MKRTPELRIKFYLRKRLRALLTGQQRTSLRSVDLFGCTLPLLRAHIERQFKPGMTWENHGSVWHIDHKIPCSKFDLTQPDHQRRCFHFTNLRPLWARENIRKSGKLLPQFAQMEML